MKGSPPRKDGEKQPSKSDASWPWVQKGSTAAKEDLVIEAWGAYAGKGLEAPKNLLERQKI